MAATINPQTLALTMYDGEAMVLDLALRAADQALEELEGRRFNLLTYSGDQPRSRHPAALVERDGRRFARWALGGGVTGQWRGEPVTYVVRESLNDAPEVLWLSTITVLPAAPQIDDYDAAPISRRVIRITRTDTASPEQPLRYQVEYVREAIFEAAQPQPEPTTNLLDFGAATNSGYLALL